jgi:hypothetical protein
MSGLAVPPLTAPWPFYLSPPQPHFDEFGTLWVFTFNQTSRLKFRDNPSIKSVKFDPRSTLRAIAPLAFHLCSNLASVEIPACVENIKSQAFKQCTALTDVKFEAGSRLSVIDGFNRCTALTRIEIPASVDAIAMEAFAECTALTEVIFPAESRLTIINGFGRCTSLCRIGIPASVQEIQFNAFAQCTALSEVVFVNRGRLRLVNGFTECTSLRRVEIPDSVEEVRFDAFRGCKALMEVIFPVNSRLRSLNGFQGCTSLYRIEVPASVTNVGCESQYPSYACAFLEGLSQREVILRSGTRMRPARKERCFRAFIAFEDEHDLKNRRRRVHVWTSGIRRPRYEWL